MIELELISRYPETTPKNPPLLFVHGSFSDARIWDVNFLPWFAAQGYEAHALSLRGHGQSGGHVRLHTWRLTDYVVDLSQVVGSMPSPPVLIGHSMGGMVVQKYLESQVGADTPVRGVVLMASVPPRGLLPSNLHLALRKPLLFQQMTTFTVFGPSFGSVAMMEELLFSKGVPRATLEEYFNLVQAESQSAALDMMWLDPLRLKPGQVTLPVLVMGAQNDQFIPTELVLETAHFYRTWAEILPDMAHAMMLELNWRDAAKLLLGWLEEMAIGQAVPTNPNGAQRLE